MDSTAAGFLPLVTKASKKRSNNFAETLILVWNGYSISEKSYNTAVNSILIRNLIQVNAFQRTYVICVREPVSGLTRQQTGNYVQSTVRLLTA